MTIVNPPTARGGPAALASLPPAIERIGTGRALRAIIVKELRQNLAFLALAILLEVVVLMVAEWFRNGFILSGLSQVNENILLLSGVRGSITLGCVVAGFLLGVFQPLADRNFDLWAFLIHRPVSRTVIFAGRAIAGMILYFLAAGVPLIILVMMAMTPSGGKVFLWSYTVPPLVDFISGIACYFAGLLAMDRRAILYGSKGIPLIAGIFATIYTLVCSSAWNAVTIDFIFIAVLATAAAGSVISHGFTLRALRTPRWALAFVLILGFSVLTFLTATGGISYVWRGRVEYNNPEIDRQPYETRHYVVMSDGSVDLLVSEFAWDKGPGQFMATSMRYLDLQGHEVVVDTQKVVPVDFYFNFDRFRVARIDRGYRDLPMDTERRITIGAYEYEWWAVDEKKVFYVHRRPAVMAGQPGDESRPWEFYGTVGVTGLAKSNIGAVPFNSPQLNFDYILTPGTLYRLDMYSYNASLVLKAAPGETFMRWETDHWFDPVYDGESQLVLTSRRCIQLSSHGQITAQIPVHDVDDYRLGFARFVTPSGKTDWAVSYTPWKTWGSPGSSCTWEIYDADGTLLSKVTVPWLEKGGTPYRTKPLSSDQLHEVHEIAVANFEMGRMEPRRRILSWRRSAQR